MGFHAVDHGALITAFMIGDSPVLPDETAAAIVVRIPEQQVQHAVAGEETVIEAFLCVVDTGCTAQDIAAITVKQVDYDRALAAGMVKGAVVGVTQETHNTIQARAAALATRRSTFCRALVGLGPL